MAEWKGVPIASGIVVINDEKGAQAIDRASASRKLDYAARRGEYADRGELEREPTRADEEAMLCDVGRALDYISREGDFSWKGAGRQVDASLWDERGPISKDEAMRSMASSGCFIECVLSVKRDYADALGLGDKESMQRLVRSTWTDSVEKWGVFERPSEIRWVAAYHTDGAHGLHCHIYTWGRPGDLKPGQTIGREQTRKAREAVFKVGYARARADFNERCTWLRDLSRQNAARQLGGVVDEGRVARLHAEGGRRGWPERVPERPDWGDDAAVARLAKQLGERLAEGRGRLSGDWKAKAVSRDLTRALENASPATRAIAEGAAECERARVEIKGYVSEAYLDRDSLVRKGREEYLSRLDHTNEASLAPERAHGRDRADAIGRRDGWRGREVGPPDRERAAEEGGRREQSRDAADMRQFGDAAQAQTPLLATAAPRQGAAGAQDSGAAGAAGPRSRRPRRRRRGEYERERSLRGRAGRG